MNKIWLIVKREYSTRVRNKMFLISTFLLPVILVLFIAGATYLSIKGKDLQKIAVYDPNGYFKDALKSSESVKFDFTTGVDTSNYEKKGYTGILVIPNWDGKQELEYKLRSPRQLGISTKQTIEKRINDAVQDKVLEQKGFTSKTLDSLRDASPKTRLKELSGNSGESKQINSALSWGVGFGSGMLIYLMMFIYGAAVMRGVMEEKTNRIAEVIVSSVKPFQLMMGKIIGIGAVGLTQFLLWMILIIGLFAASRLFISAEVLREVQQMQQSSNMGGAGMANASEQAQQYFKFQQTMGSAPWTLILCCFVFYFLGGYLFYAALFASVGCMVNEDPQEAQSLMLPITMPIVFGFIIMQSAIQNPNSSLAFWGSMIPFTSPIVMMARIPSEPPAWQILLSMGILIAGFLFTGWMAGKIYRTGILMYGKKGSWKQMMKWVFAKS